MLFSAQIPLKSLIPLCRTLRHSLGAGLNLRDVFRQQATRGPAPVRPVAQRIAERLDQGDSLASALKQEERAFPPLFLSLAEVGEQTGNLAEMFGELEKYYTLQLQLRRQFRSQSILPVVQFVLAVLVIAGLIFILGVIAQVRGGEAPKVFGLQGAAGAISFLAVCFGVVLAAIGSYFLLGRMARQRAAVDALLLRLPVLGSCLQALALARLAMALRLTLDSSLAITRAVRLSLQATGNAAFAARAAQAVHSLKTGDGLTLALTSIRLLPKDFLTMVAVAEEGGRVPEMMQHQTQFYHEEAARRLKALTRAATFMLWMVYAGFMVVAIFRLANIYLAALGGR